MLYSNRIWSRGTLCSRKTWYLGRFSVVWTDLLWYVALTWPNLVMSQCSSETWSFVTCCSNGTCVGYVAVAKPWSCLAWISGETWSYVTCCRRRTWSCVVECRNRIWSYICYNAGTGPDQDLQNPRKSIPELPPDPGGPLPQRCSISQQRPCCWRHSVHPRTPQLSGARGAHARKLRSFIGPDSLSFSLIGRKAPYFWKKNIEILAGLGLTFLL